jgi:hypothetical protein
VCPAAGDLQASSLTPSLHSCILLSWTGEVGKEMAAGEIGEEIDGMGDRRRRGDSRRGRLERRLVAVMVLVSTLVGAAG